ncbi:MAG: type-F conjugative transfer system secretin TraK [Proteobacteria bacterium]|nr:type-F conjugative transfer system secretin TraK [Pseudomonadota bacterium]
MRRRSDIAGRAACIALVTALPMQALALQVLDARDGVAVEAILSIKEPTRIRIEGAAITDVFGNIHSSSCGAGSAAGTTAGIVAPATNPGGEVVLECDRDKGEIYIRPVGDSPKPVNLFVSSAHATYTLVLRRADTPADTIVIRDRTQRSAPASLANGTHGGFGPSGPSAHHIRTMKALLVAMASDRVPPDIRVDELHQPMQLWAETRFVLTGRYEGRGLVGEKYLLKNIGPSPMVLSEQEFDRPDSKEGGQVLSVAVEKHKLQPGETTQVFVIRRGGQP